MKVREMHKEREVPVRSPGDFLGLWGKLARGTLILEFIF